MGDTLLTLLLGPLLWWQGQQVRRHTPRLPEAAGERRGECGHGPLLRLLVLGDSAAAGVGAANQEAALCGCLCRALAPHYRVHWRLLAQTGLTLAEVTACLRAQPAVHYDAVVVSVGVNDVTGGTAPARWTAQLQALLALLQQQCAARHIVLTAVPPMQYFPALPQPLRWFLGRRAARLNRANQRLLAAHRPDRVRLLQHDLPLKPADMASDGFHPSTQGYARWAAQVAALLCAMHDSAHLDSTAAN